MNQTSSDKPRKKKIYGLPSIDMGDWVSGEDPRDGHFVENTSIGFKVFMQYPHPRYETGTRYIVRGPDGFRMGFALSETQKSMQTPPDSGIPGVIEVGSVGGTYRRDGMYVNEGFAVLADAKHFRNRGEQDAFLNALEDAVPRIPAIISHAFRQDGGFGYTVRISDDLQKALGAGNYISDG